VSSSKYRFSVFLVLILFVLGACNMPGRGTPTQQSAADFIYTAAAQTVQAQLTQVNQPPPTGSMLTPIPPNATTQVPATGTTASPIGVTTTPAPGTATQASCDQAEFEKDVTYPDNTEVDPGQTFVKTWQLKNTGSCTWTSDYSIVFVKGDSMDGPASTALTTGTVAPGESVDVSVTLTAPDTGGTYRGDWKLRNGSDQIFGVGKDGSKTFWVQIDVVVATGIVYDFLAKGSSASWVSGVGNEAGTALDFNGPEDDPNGVAKIADRARLETGGISGKILLTAPKREDNGFISGTYPTYTVQNGDHFKVRLGFLVPSGDCGNGRVKFQFGYKDGDSLRVINEWTKPCNGSLMAVDVDLSSLKGEAIKFVLRVVAESSPQDDWAVWNSARIEH